MRQKANETDLTRRRLHLMHQGAAGVALTRLWFHLLQLGEYPALMAPVVRTHAPGSGPFADEASRIKHRYVG